MTGPLLRLPSTPDPLLAWDGRTGDVHLLRSLVMSADGTTWDGVLQHTNVPQELWLWPGIGYGWGPQRREGATLALGILDRHIPPAPGELCEEWHVPLACHWEAFIFAATFQEDFLTRLPSHGGRIAGHVIREWIAVQRRRWRTPRADLALTTLTSQYPDWPSE